MRPELVLLYFFLTFLSGFMVILVLALCATASRTDDILDEIEREQRQIESEIDRNLMQRKLEEIANERH